MWHIYPRTIEAQRGAWFKRYRHPDCGTKGDLRNQAHEKHAAAALISFHGPSFCSAGAFDLGALFWRERSVFALFWHKDWGVRSRHVVELYERAKVVKRLAESKAIRIGVLG